MAEKPAFSIALSQLLVAYTVECDTEFEQQVPHRTATQGRGVGTGPWLVSMAMWANFLRYLPPGGATRGELEPLRRLANLAGLQRWGYVLVEPSDGGNDEQDLIRPRRAGTLTQAVWPRIVEAVDARWASRFGDDVIAELRSCLAALTDRDWPDYLPVVGYGDGMRTHVPDAAALLAATGEVEPATNLAACVSRVLVAYTVDYEQRTRLSLTMVADVLRPIGADGILLRDLPAAGGVSKEGIAAAVTFLTSHQLATVAPDPVVARANRIVLTKRGLGALARHPERVSGIDGDWSDRFGAAALERLREVLAALRSSTDADGGPMLAAGLTPYPESWRAKPPYLKQTRTRLADPWGTLPQQPMVLHRGGYPDGS